MLHSPRPTLRRATRWLSFTILGATLVACSGSSPMRDAAAPRPVMKPKVEARAGGRAPSQPAARPGARLRTGGAKRSPSSAPRPAHARGAKEVTSSKDGDGAMAQMLIFTGRLGMEVDQSAFASSIDTIVDVATERGGYVSRQNDRMVEVRVPSARFREAMKEIEKLGVIVRRSVEAQDVSDRYFDMKVRLKSLRATRDRLQEFLKRAKSIQEVLRVEGELRRLNSQIDSLEGKMRYLAAKVAFSTIHVQLQAKPKPKVVVVRKTPPPPPPPPPRTVALPIKWLNQVGLNRLLKLNK